MEVSVVVANVWMWRNGEQWEEEEVRGEGFFFFFFFFFFFVGGGAQAMWTSAWNGLCQKLLAKKPDHPSARRSSHFA